MPRSLKIITDAEPNLTLTTEPEVELPSYEELERAINKLKDGKMPGSDAISAEMIKKGGKTIRDELYKLILKVWEEEIVPPDWKHGIICPIYKKGDNSRYKPLHC